MTCAIGFQGTTHPNWQPMTINGTGVSTLTDTGAPFAIATNEVLIWFIAAPPTASSVWVRAVSDSTGGI